MWALGFFLELSSSRARLAQSSPQPKFNTDRLMLLSRLATTSARTLVRPQAAPLARFLRHGSSQTVRSTAALIDPALLSRDDSSKAGPALHAAENLDALLRGDTKKPNAQNDFTETAVADAPQLHGRYASIAAPPRAQTMPKPEFTEEQAADHAWRQTNHIWSNDELEKVSIEKHEPVTMSDHFMKGVMNILYHGFNFVTGYDPVDPSPRSVAWRLIILESFAGVPGFVAAGFRHFYSLRTLKRDHGAIYTFLEEAENVRASEQKINLNLTWSRRWGPTSLRRRLHDHTRVRAPRE